MNNNINTQELEPDSANTELEESPTISDCSICLIPSQYFFIELISFENEDLQLISSKEAYRFFELQLESLSPLPLDQLLWGYYTLPNAKQSILFACLKSRLANEKFGALENYTWVLPEFLPQLALETIQPSELKDLSKLETLNTKETEEYLLHLEKDLTISVAHSITNKESDVSPISVSLEVPVLWSSDIRSKNFKGEEQKKRARLAFVNKSFILSLYFIALILISELLLAGANLWLNKYTKKIETQAPTVSLIIDQGKLNNKLEKISKNEVRPIKLLEDANQMRINTSPNIVYNNVEITNENIFTIKGTAGSVNDLIRYVTKLKQSNDFNVLEDPKSLTRGGKTTFTLKMNFQSDASQF